MKKLCVRAAILALCWLSFARCWELGDFKNWGSYKVGSGAVTKTGDGLVKLYSGRPTEMGYPPEDEIPKATCQKVGEKHNYVEVYVFFKKGALECKIVKSSEVKGRKKAVVLKKSGKHSSLTLIGANPVQNPMDNLSPWSQSAWAFPNSCQDSECMVTIRTAIINGVVTPIKTDAANKSWTFLVTGEWQNYSHGRTPEKNDLSDSRLVLGACFTDPPKPVFYNYYELKFEDDSNFGKCTIKEAPDASVKVKKTSAGEVEGVFVHDSLDFTEEKIQKVNNIVDDFKLFRSHRLEGETNAANPKPVKDKLTGIKGATFRRELKPLSLLACNPKGECVQIESAATTRWRTKEKIPQGGRDESTGVFMHWFHNR